MKIQVALIVAAFLAVAVLLGAGAWRGGPLLRAACVLLLVAEAAGIAAALEVYVPQVNVLTRSFARGRRGSRLVGLSFDDGPHGEVTPRILDVLKERGVAATFFVLGGRVAGNEAVVARAAREGHEIGNHGFSHAMMHRMGGARVEEEIGRTGALLEAVTGRKPALLRTPHGFVTPLVGRAARRLGCRIVAWTVGVWDTDPGVTADEIAARALAAVRGGDILLLHDGNGDDPARAHRATAEALGRIIGGVEARGLSLVPVGRLIAEAAGDEAR